jgi:putative nucleic acid binding protein
MEKRIKYGGFLLLLLAGMTLYVYVFEYHRSINSPGAFKAAEDRMTAHELVSLFDSSEAWSGRRFLYKILSVRGIVKKVTKNNRGNYTVDLGGSDTAKGNSNNEPDYVSCSLDSTYNSFPPTLETGDSISIRGICAGHLTNVLMVQCIIEK